MNIDWNEIKEKYPNKFNLLTHYLLVKIIPADRIIINSENELVYTLYYPEFDFPICYCNIEKFFKDNDIEINIMKLYIDGEYVINIFTCDGINNDFRKYKKDDKAKEQAIYKAFEILEQQLKD